MTAEAEDTAPAQGGGNWIARLRRGLARLVAGPDTEPARPEENGEPRLSDLAPVLEASPDPVLLLDGQGRIAAVNAHARRRWSAAPGIRLSAVLRNPPLLDALQATLADRQVREVEYVIAEPAEHFMCAVSPMEWEGMPGVLLVFRNRTEQMAAERLRVDFVANASHELRTPLTALSMLIETIAGPARDNEADRTKFLAMMQVQADRMRRLIDDLLALSRIELDEHVPPMGRADLAAVAREAVDSMQPIAAQRNVRVEVKGAPPAALVTGDRFQIAQVVQNLIDNAVKYSAEGGVVEIEIGSAPQEETLERAGRQWPNAGRLSLVSPAPGVGRIYVFLRVVDQGPGIALRHLPRLGERFFRVEREAGADRGGTGLGLAIVKHIVARHRGGLVVESEPGRGSAFAIYLESAYAPERTARAPAA